MEETLNVVDLDGPFQIKWDSYSIQQIPLSMPPSFAYLITSNNESALIHPMQDITLHIDKFIEHNLNIKHIIDTSYHSDLN